MGAADSTTGRMLYPINAGKKDTDIVNTSDYDDRLSEFSNGDAFSSVSVNPQFKTTRLEYENSNSGSITGQTAGTNGNDWVDSANFFEIRNTPHSVGISNDSSSRIVNRIYPTNTTLDSYATNCDETNSFKVKVFDSENTIGETNSKFTYSTTDYPSSGVIGLDVDNYDYFILINPNLTSATTDKIRPHFAKITRITSFDEFGDGLEFEPKYPTAVPVQSNFEIYKGPHKINDTDIVAVSYGLRGDTLTTSSKYDVLQRAIRPTFYFYNDRLDENDQLDYSEKYNVTSERWWDYGTELEIGIRSAHTQNVKTTAEFFHLLTPADRHKLIEGQSIFDDNNNYIGNIKEKISSGTNSANRFEIDYARNTLTAFNSTSTRVSALGSYSVSPTSTIGAFYTGTNTYATTSGDGTGATVSITVTYNSSTTLRSVTAVSLVFGGSGYTTSSTLSVALGSSHTVTIPVTAVTGTSVKIKIGKTIQNVVFRTQPKFGNIVKSLGRSNINATLVDSNYTTDSNTSNSAFDATRWDSAFTKMKRHVGDLLTPTVNTIDGNLTGPNRYITFEKTEYKNNKIEPVRDSSLNSPKNKLTKMAHITVMDNSGLQHLKIKEGDVLKLRNNIFNGKFIKKEIQGIITKTAASTLTLYNISTNINLHHILSTNDIVEIDGYHYVVNVVANKTLDTQQSFTIKDSKLTSANTWSGRSNLNAIDNNSDGDTTDAGDTQAIDIIKKTMYVMPYSGVLNFEFISDAAAKLTNGGVFQTLTMNGIAVDKTDSRMHLSTMTPLRYNTHTLEVDYADKNNKYAKLKNPSKTFYQKSNVSADIPYYYNGSYSINDEVFSGEVEDIDVKTSSGFTSFKIAGRDDSSKLLGKSINRSLTHYSDVIKTSIPPILNPTLITNISAVAISGKTVTLTTSSGGSYTPSDALDRYSLLINHNGDLIGEVKSMASNTEFGITTKTITLFDQALTTTENNTIKAYNPYSSSQTNYITGTKALQSNITHTGGVADFTSISEKGLSFKSGIELNYTTGNLNGVGTLTHSTLQLSSNDSSTKTGETLGYDISSPKSISTEDSIFAFTIGNENGISATKSDILTPNSEMFDVIKINEQDFTSPVLEIAPTFPIVLGRVESNSLDTRGNVNLYLVNNNIETGGFIHRLQPSFEQGGNITPSDTIRYWDLQQINSGGLVRTSDTIYREGISKQKTQGYAVGYGVKADGTVQTVTATVNNKPLAGSNTLKDWNYLSTFYHATAPLITSYASSSDNISNQTDIMYSNFEQIDPRTIPYELLATGDILPSSKQRHNSIFNSANSKPFETYGAILESASSLTDITNHELYDGATSTTLKREINFETATIKGSGKHTAEIKRWGIIRLVEATFDWHFNPIDFESLKPPSEIPSLNYFDYVMVAPPSILSGFTANISSGSLSGTLSGQLTVGDVVHRIDKIGDNSSESNASLKVDGVTSGFSIAYNSSNNLDYNQHLVDNHGVLIPATPVNNILKFDGHVLGSGSNIRINGVERFRLFTSTDTTFDALQTTTDSGFYSDRTNGHNDIKFHTSWLLHPPINSGIFSHQLLEKASVSGNYDPMNVILPLIIENKSSSSNKRDMRFSPAHAIDGWDDTDASELTGDEGIVRLHMSRVVSAMVDNSFGLSSPTIGTTDKEALGIGRTHVYDNCIGLFRNAEAVVPSSLTSYGWPTEVTLTSSPMGFSGYGSGTKQYHDTDSEFTTYALDYSSDTDKDQHTPTTRVFNWTNPEVETYINGTEATQSIAYKASILGTKTKVYPFDKIGTGSHARRSYTYRKNSHDTTALTLGGQDITNQGQMYSSQYIVKPTFNLTGDTGVVVYSNSNKTITFTLNNDSTHTWLSFMPNLTGYYLVSEKLVDGDDLTDAKHHGVPTYISKITNHTISTAPSTSNYEAHTITLDTHLTNGSIIGNGEVPTHGAKYRLMRISETTFRNTPQKIEFNVMHDEGLEYKTVTTNFRKGSGSPEDSTNNKTFQEAVYSMYLKLDVDNDILADNPFIESRTTASAIRGFEDGEVLSVHLTDGINKTQKQITVSTTRKKRVSNATEPCLVFNYDGNLTGNGVVSCGEIINLTIGKKPRLKNIKHCYIGTTYDVGSNIDTELSNIIKDVGLEFNGLKNGVNFTTNIVDSNGTNTVVCLENVTEVKEGSIIYTQDGHLIGKIQGISNKTITFASGDKYYIPPQYSNIVTYNDKTFVSNLTFNNADAHGAINALTKKKGLDYKVEGNKITFTDIENRVGLRKQKVEFTDLAGIEPIQNNTSLFDKINKVIVVGDGVKFELTSATIKNEKTKTVNDSSITTVEEAKIEAIKTLQIHSGEARKIQMQINKEGFENLEAGDILILDFPTYNIPLGEYIIFEIENVLGVVLTMTVGTYTKGIAERLTEITQEDKKNTFHLLSANSIGTVGGKAVFDNLKLRLSSIEYKVVGETLNANMGFDDVFGFTEVVGFETTSTGVIAIKKEYKNRFYD